jgi:hypothetical protein
MLRYVAPVAGILLASCATIPPAGPLPPASTAFDGEYAGRDMLISGSFVCGASNYPLTLSVSGGRFDYPFAVNAPRTAPLPVQVSPDGALVGELLYGTLDYTPVDRYHNTWALLRGQIAGGALDAVVWDERCVRRVTARRV